MNSTHKRMKKIYVVGVAPSFYRDIEHLLGLFFEDVKITDQQNESDGSLHISIVEENPIRATVTFTEQSESQKWQATEQREAAVSEGKEYQRRVKQTVKHAILSVLQEATGLKQPWGILTGVRPTKLLHTMLLDGLSIDEAGEVLRTDYRLHPSKTELLKEIVHRQTTVLPDLYQLDQGVSLYIGIPFCPTKCAYCTFPAYAIQGRTGSVEEFLIGLQEEIQAIGDWIKERNLPVTTIYLGGGTPTSITAEQMDALFRQLKASIPNFDQVREWTVEAGRPDTLDEEKLELLRRWKVDRISINPQSFKEETLKLIGRHHTVKETLEKYQLARQMGLHNINMDLIIGLPNEGLEEFQNSLDLMEVLRPESLTVHTLSFKRGSFMTQNKEKFHVADRDETAEMVQRAREWTQKMGYVPYYLYRQKNILGNQENVGYAFPGSESLYNIIIMEERQTIIGLGCGAVSKIISPLTGRIERFPNPKEPQAYINSYRQEIVDKIKVLNEAYGIAFK